MLILLTNYYPYFRGEEYIESEIQYLSKKFENIIVIPTLLSKNMDLTRKVPDNVRVLTSFYENTKVSKVTSMLSTLINGDSVTRRRVKNDSRGKLINKFYNYYFEGRTKNSYKQIVKMLEEEKISKDEHVVLYSYWFHSTAKIAVELKNNYFKNVAYTVSRGHRYDVIEEVSAVKFLPFREYLLSNVDNLFLVSSIISDDIKKDYPKFSYKIGYKRLGSAKIVEKELAQKEKFIIVSCSGVRKVKHLEKIVESLSIIDNEKLDIEWYHFGVGPLSEEIEKLAKEKIKNIKYKFMGHISNKELLEWYQDNRPSVFLNASSSEGVPVSIMEAMSLGIPTIATDAGGTRELVKNDINGILLQTNTTPEEISEAIKEFYHFDNEKYSKYSKNAYDTWNQDFNSKKNYEEFANMLYEKLENK